MGDSDNLYFFNQNLPSYEIKFDVKFSSIPWPTATTGLYLFLYDAWSNYQWCREVSTEKTLSHPLVGRGAGGYVQLTIDTSITSHIFPNCSVSTQLKKQGPLHLQGPLLYL